MTPPQAQTRAERRAVQESQRAEKAIRNMSPNSCELILVRHGQTQWNLEMRLQGQMLPGPPLDEVGHRQAAVLAERLRQEAGVTALYSSDLLRATQTADAIAAATGLQAVSSPQLRERALGYIEGLTYAEAEARQPEAYKALKAHSINERIPGGGESVADLQERAAATLEGLARQHPMQRVVVVSHGGFLHAVHRRATGHAPPTKNINGALNFVRVDPGERQSKPSSWAVVRWGVVDHLDGVEYMHRAFGGGKSG